MMSLKSLRFFKICDELAGKCIVQFLKLRPVTFSLLFALLAVLCVLLLLCKGMMLSWHKIAVAQERAGSIPGGMSLAQASSVVKETQESPAAEPKEEAFLQEHDPSKGKADSTQAYSSQKKADFAQAKKIDSDVLPKALNEATLPSPSSASFNPMKLTPYEIKVLETLTKRRKELDEKDKKINLRMALLQASEQRIDQKIETIQNLKSAIEELLKKYDNQEKENLQTLAKIYEKMKPKEAARIFSELDMPVLLNVIAYIKEAKASQIIAFMDTKRARDLTLALAKERRAKDAVYETLQKDT